MKKILRSVINVDSSLDQEDLQKNLYPLADSKLVFLKGEDQDIWDYVLDYARTYTEPPSVNTVQDHFEKKNKLGVLDRIKKIKVVSKTYSSSDFENLVRQQLKEQNERETAQVIQDAGNILSNGLDIKRGRTEKFYEGYKDALRFIIEESDELLMADTGDVFRTNIMTDAEQVREDFRNTLSNAHNMKGRPCGLPEIDRTNKGVKPGELWLHAGFVGQLKTTFALNWAYKTACIFRYNTYYYSLEMPVEQIRLILYVMHSNHPKFTSKGYEPLNYAEIRDGVDKNGQRISKEKIKFFNMVAKDMENGFESGKYGSIFIECPNEPKTTIPMIKNRIELVHQNTPIHLVVIDYLGLVSAERSRHSYREELNQIFRSAKQMCLTFNQGEKIPIVALHQINREGKKRADQNDGVYDSQALADSSAAERTADVITSTYLNDDLKANNQVKIACIKNRDNESFQPFLANVHFPSRYISHLKRKSGKVGF